MFQEMREIVGVITGATSGIGRASALLLAQYGVKIVLAGRDEKRGQELQDEISSNGGSALFVKTDVSKYESVKNLMGKAQSTFGTIHYALNNAVLWLCASMSAHVNGDVIFIDGGSSLGS
ncbi:MAG: SDR family NAD(P)-dependent oxidoreductase [Chlamydiia bacterium]|nr:SDR family NAD(P)-dependent oxidoreductase [Chlamydiia bacterium]